MRGGVPSRGPRPSGSRSCSGSPPTRGDSRSRPAPLRPAAEADGGGGRRRRRRQKPMPDPSMSRSRSPLPMKKTPPMRKDAFGRSKAARQRYGDGSVSSAEGGGAGQRPRSQDSRSRSASRGKMPGMMPGMFPGMPGMFPGMPGMPGMPPGGSGFPFPGMPGMNPAAMMNGMSGDMLWEAHKQYMASMQGGGQQSRGGHRDGPRDSRRSRSRSKGGYNQGRSRGRSPSDDREGKTVATVPLPRSIMGRVIGKQGATIKEIREVSGARIDAEDVNDDTCEFKVSGSAESVDKAKRMIRDIVDKTAAGPLPDRMDKDSGPTEVLEFPSSVTGRIIGAKGAKIAEIRQVSGAKVQVEKGDDKCKVHMSGTADQLERARAMVTKVAEEAEDSFNKPAAEDDVDTIHDTVEYPASATGGIIGSRGAKIAEVRAMSGAKVQVEKGDNCCKVLISGTADQIESAKKMVQRLVEEGQERAKEVNRRDRGNAAEMMEVDKQVVGRVIGKGGETIQLIQRRSGARLDVDAKGEPCTVRITGDHESVVHARRLIDEIIDKGGLRSDGGSHSRDSHPPPPPGGGYWPESGFAYGGQGSSGYQDGYGDYMGMYGGGYGDGAGGGNRAQDREIELSNRNEIDMDEL